MRFQRALSWVCLIIRPPKHRGEAGFVEAKSPLPILRYIAVVLAVPVLVLLLANFGAWKNSDDHLLSIFHKNREPLEELRSTSMSDPNSRACFGDSSIYFVGCSDRSRRVYLKLLAKIPSGARIQPDPPFGMWILLAHGGLSAVGPTWYKGIVYLSTNPREQGVIISSLDHASSLPPSSMYFRKIEGRWFLYYQRYAD
jgi:hypothetical protein